jgi:hypothetical protein
MHQPPVAPVAPSNVHAFCQIESPVSTSFRGCHSFVTRFDAVSVNSPSIRQRRGIAHTLNVGQREWDLWLPRNPAKMVRRSLDARKR